jgi:hypothetical protein
LSRALSYCTTTTKKNKTEHATHMACFVFRLFSSRSAFLQNNILFLYYNCFIILNLHSFFLLLLLHETTANCDKNTNSIYAGCLYKACFFFIMKALERKSNCDTWTEHTKARLLKQKDDKLCNNKHASPRLISIKHYAFHTNKPIELN